MMAFFMLMWLLNATTEQQRQGIADYFSPTIPLAKISGGGDGAFGGDDPTQEDVLIHSGKGSSPFERGEVSGQAAHEVAAVEALHDLEQVLLGRGGESLVSENAMRHIVTRVTDEGLVIEFFDRPERHLFEQDSTTPDPILKDLAALLARVLLRVENPISISAHSRAYPIVATEDPTWDLTLERAQITRDLMLDAGFNPQRLHRLTGHSDRSLADGDPFAVRNNRLEITVLRTP